MSDASEMRARGRVKGVEGVWWSPRSSKPLRPDRVGLGGFDSHTLPPARPWQGLRRLLALSLAVAAGVVPLRAQSVEGTRVGVERPAADTLLPRQERPSAVLEGPPITPRRAFFTSLLLPGAGQARLDRPYAGGVFLLIEAISLTLMHRSAEDLRIARSFRGDSMPARYQVDAATGLVARDAAGAPIVAAWETPRYNDAWVRTRRLHLEDWTAVLIFNHLFAGADAFVAAQLWDLPQKVAIKQTPFGPAIAATFTLGRRP
jgi:hypothetical protein